MNSLRSPERKTPSIEQAPVRRFPDLRSVVAWIWTPLALCALVAIIVYGLKSGSAETQETVMDGLVNLILVIGLYIFVGNSGVFSFGQVSFMAIGAYTSALLTIPLTLKHVTLPSLPHFLEVAQFGHTPAAIIGGAVAVLFALMVAGPLMRLSGLAAGIGTFALLVIVNVVASNWTAVTRGQETMIGVPIDLTPGQGLVWACVAIVVAYMFQESRVGLRLRASREDEVAARSLGVSVLRERTIAFCLSAFFAGIAGALYAHYLGSFGAEAFYLDLTFLTFVMLVIGGVNSLSGAVIGSIVVSALAQILTQLQGGAHVGPVFVTLPDGSEEIVLALFMLVVLIVRPKGLLGNREIPNPFAMHRGASARRGLTSDPPGKTPESPPVETRP